jgi:hypothetical protein
MACMLGPVGCSFGQVTAQGVSAAAVVIQHDDGYKRRRTGGRWVAYFLIVGLTISQPAGVGQMLLQRGSGTVLTDHE